MLLLLLLLLLLSLLLFILAWLYCSPNLSGDQPEDIADQTRNLTLKYIERPDTFVLAVTPATVDLETCEALQLARRVDPRGERTLGVVTKPDVREEGGDPTKVIEILKNETYPLAKGYIAVKNRSKRQMAEGMTAEESVEVRK